MDKNSCFFIKYKSILLPLLISIYRELKLKLFILGSKAGFLSSANIIYPVIGISFEPDKIILMFIIGLLIRFLLGIFILPEISLLSLLLLRLPGLMGSLYLSVHSKYLKLLLAFIPLFLFISHPIGIKAWPYGLYWLIPIAIIFFGKKDQYIDNIYNIFKNFLASSFITHAFGSIVYLYLYHIEVETWYFLIPIVFWERLLLSLGSLSLYYLFKFVYNLKFYFYKSSYNCD